ncbi:hypothetical protein [Niallia sp. 01092]|uniref:hypothetical protein n=1 Tax=unclassified Niallia TaxID=2837522 RepID=UPI003FD3017C
MFRKWSNIDFTDFNGQKVVEVKSEVGLKLGVLFEKGILIIECPWRLLSSNQIAVGYSDCIKSSSTLSYKTLEKHIKGKKIISIQHYENISDLVVEFENNIILELFHDSSYYEGWQLKGANEFLLVSLPGGAYAEF